MLHVAPACMVVDFSMWCDLCLYGHRLFGRVVSTDEIFEYYVWFEDNHVRHYYVRAES